MLEQLFPCLTSLELQGIMGLVNFELKVISSQDRSRLKDALKEKAEDEEKEKEHIKARDQRILQARNSQFFQNIEENHLLSSPANMMFNQWSPLPF